MKTGNIRIQPVWKLELMEQKMKNQYIHAVSASDVMTAWGSYTYTFNNPVRLVDPTGMGPEVLDWEPRVEYGCNITYVSEDGDSYETFVEQSGEEAAQKTIEANFGDLPISPTGVLLPQEGGYKYLYRREDKAPTLLLKRRNEY